MKKNIEANAFFDSASQHNAYESSVAAPAGNSIEFSTSMRKSVLMGAGAASIGISSSPRNGNFSNRGGASLD